MPSIMTYRILRSCTRTRSSRVEIPSRRAASVARSGSAGIAASLGIVETQSTTEGTNLRFLLDHDSKMAGLDQGVSGVLQRCQESQGLLKSIVNRVRRFLLVGRRHQSHVSMTQVSRV